MRRSCVSAIRLHFVRGDAVTPLLAFALLVAGDASYYDAGVMERVLDYRLSRGQVQPCPECVGYAALIDCRDIGRLIWLDWGQRGGIGGPYLVVDCAQAAHRAGLIKRNRVAEVDHATAMRHRMAGPVPVRVLWRPPDVCAPAGPC